MVSGPVFKDIVREIKKTAGRFVSITLLLALAVGFYSGLRATQPDMRATVDKYMDECGMFDIRILSNLGLSEADLEAVRALPGVSDAEGMHAVDAIVRAPDSDIIISLQTLTTRGINAPELLSGEMPRSANECLAEQRFLDRMNLSIGDTLHIARVSEEMESALVVRDFKITGTVRSPVYMSYVQRGVSMLDSGRISAFVLIPDEAVSLDYYTEINALVSGAAGEQAYSDGYESVVTPVLDAAEGLGKTRAPLRREELTAEAREKISDAEAELSEKSDELEDARRALAEARAEYDDGQVRFAEARLDADKKFADAERELDNAGRQITDGRAQLQNAERELEARIVNGEAELEAKKAELETGAVLLAAAWDEYHASYAEYDGQLKEWETLPDAVKETMPDTEARIKAAASAMQSALSELETRQMELDNGYIAYIAGYEYFIEEISSARERLREEDARLLGAGARLSAGRAELEDERERVEREIADAEAELSDARQKIEDAEREISDGEIKLRDAEREIEDAEREIEDVPDGEWYVQGRDSNYGYSGFGQDADRMGALGGVFPAIFFAVAALVCLTTMTRMVDEQRIEIGTFKSLGLHRATAAVKFIVYGGLAAIIGLAAGLALGMALLPRFIFHAYSILYDLPPLLTPFHYETVTISVAAAAVCTLGATLIACAAALHETPAALLRPRAPTPGRRVFLEYITPLWRRMSFFGKVTARNILRYKKRLIMTITGIAGCTALLVTGFGLRDSIIDLPGRQFEELYKYDLMAALASGADDEDRSELRAMLDENTLVGSYGLVRTVPADLSAGGAAYSGDIIVPERPGDIGDIITMRDAYSGLPLTLTDGGAVITAKLAELLGVRTGDTLTIDSGTRRTVTVIGITEHYVYHYAYMTPECYERVFGEKYRPNEALIGCRDETEETAASVSAELLRQNAVGYVTYFKSVTEAFEKSIGSVNSVVMIIVFAAAALALVVLFNLTNINITERRRELATIKVLGFYDGEVTWYIIRENTFLTLAAIAIGLVGGKFLHGWLVKTVEVDFTMFVRTVSWISYVGAALLTAVFAVIVNFAGHLRMRRINMVESLKVNE